MAVRNIVKADGTVEQIKLTRFHTPKGAKRVDWSFREVVPLSDRAFKVNKDCVAVYHDMPSVESGMDDDGLLFQRFGRFMQVGIEHIFRYIHLFHLVPPGTVVLDAACGYGELGKLLYTERKACTYVGMDVAGKKLSAAARLGWGSAKTMFIQRDLSKRLPFGDDVFDCVVSTEFIEHIPKVHAQRFLGEVRRVVKPGGMVIITTPNKQWGQVDPVHPVEYTYDETLEMVATAKLKLVKTFGLKLRGNVRIWDEVHGKMPVSGKLWKGVRQAYPSIWAKCMHAVNRPRQSVFWSLVATKPEEE